MSKNMNDYRIVKRKDGDNWIDIEFKDIKPMDIIQVTESTGEPVQDERGALTFKVLSELRRTGPKKVLTCDVEPILD